MKKLLLAVLFVGLVVGSVQADCPPDDGVISADDYAAVQLNFGNTGDPCIPGDYDGDGKVTADDYAYVQLSFGTTYGPLPELGDIPKPLVGDANHDGIVSADDYASIQVHFGDTGEIGIPGDANWDGVVSADDYAAVWWRDGSVYSVPELADTPEPLYGDANHDGMVSADDYASIQIHFGDTGDIGILGDANWDGVVSADDYAAVGTRPDWPPVYDVPELGDIPEPHPGDANHDGMVSADDYASIQVHFGDTGEIGIPGDANWDGVVSADDYAAVKISPYANWDGLVSADDYGIVQQGFNGDGAIYPGSTVPEPATLSLLVIGGLVLIRRKK